jgi:hypothetical protein
MLLRWIGQKLIFPTTCFDGTNVVLVYTCVLMCCKQISAEVVLNF